jgi:hypothetical protein
MKGKMMAKYRILWIEDDYMDALATHLNGKDYELVRAYQVSSAEITLENEGATIDLVILDLMIDLEVPDIDRGYNEDNTANSYRTGLHFYRRNYKRLQELDIPVIVYTILGNQVDIKREFHTLGLPDDNFLDKNRFSNVNDVDQQIEKILRNRLPKRKAETTIPGDTK